MPTAYGTTGRPVPAQTGGDGQAGSPLELEATDWKAGARRAAREFKADRASMSAAGMAFYWFLAVFPALVAAVGLLGLFDAGATATEAINDAVRSILPGDAARVLTDAVTRAGDQSEGAAVVATLVGLGIALWSASAGMVAMQTGLDVAYDVPQDRTFVKKRLVALALLGVTAVLGGLATVMVVFGQPIGETVRDDFPMGGAFVLVWTAVRWAVAIASVTVLFAAFYYLAPNRDSPRWAWVSPGGVVAAVVWLAASVGFSFYVSSFGSYAETYGSLAGVVVLLLWLYLSALAVMAGGELNAELERQSAMRAGRLPPPGRPGGGAGRAADARLANGHAGRAGDADAGDTAAPGSPEAVREWARRMREVRQSSNR